MRVEAAGEQLSELASLLKERVGLYIRPDGYSALTIALSARFDELNGRIGGPLGYLELLRSPEGDEELRRLLPLVTVGKTSFFRDERQFRALAALMPGLLQAARARGRPVAIWSAGCEGGDPARARWAASVDAAATPRKTRMETQLLTRMPAITCASSVRMASIQNRPAV